MKSKILCKEVGIDKKQIKVVVVIVPHHKVISNLKQMKIMKNIIKVWIINLIIKRLKLKGRQADHLRDSLSKLWVRKVNLLMVMKNNSNRGSAEEDLESKQFNLHLMINLLEYMYFQVKMVLLKANKLKLLKQFNSKIRLLSINLLIHHVLKLLKRMHHKIIVWVNLIML